MKITDCPKCGSPGFEIIDEDVDIGVGTQPHILYGECLMCGQVEYCDMCGAWETKEGVLHEQWCVYHTKEASER